MPAHVNKSLTGGMPLIALSMLIAAATPGPNAPVAERIATVTVHIIAGEEIRFGAMGSREQKPIKSSTTLQKRTRKGMPMIEFY